MGPALVTADEIPDPHCLDLELTVNGVPKQRTNTRDMIFSVPFLVSYLSEVMTLEPGDVIATGTPAKLPEAANPQRFLEAGDVVRITIEKLGVLGKSGCEGNDWNIERKSTMARFMRLEVINTLLEIGVVPLFYHGEVETAVELVNACARGGARVIEFTNRGEMAYPVFAELVKHFAKADPSVILGVGSIIDAPTAALYLAAGANFIVGPSLNPEMSRLCNRRKILYIPGCATEK